MTPHIKLINEISILNTNIAGGKGASLGEMTQAGILVPSGFVILSVTFDEFLKETGLNIEINAVLDSVNHKEKHTIQNASEKIQALILNSQISNGIIEEINSSFQKLNSKYVAVRSSATTEDSNTTAWAGQLESYLNVTQENLFESVKKCWASLFTLRSLFYRFEKDLHRDKISVAVVVQTMVQSEFSGVAFSVHPVTKDANQLIIEAGVGLGEAIVLGKITPDSYVVEKEPIEIINKNIVHQEKGLFLLETGGSKWKNITREQSGSQTLSDEQIRELSKIIVGIERHYGFPVDIEWAFEKEKFYIVQSRPITTLKK